LRIGYSTRSPIDTPVHPQAVAAVEAAAALLTDLGHHVEPAEPAVDGRQLAHDFLTMWCAEVAAIIAEVRRVTGAGAGRFELDNRLLAAAARTTRAADYLTAHHRWNEHTRALAAFHEHHDLLLTPTLAQPPVRIGALDTPRWMRLLGQGLLHLGLAGPLAKTKTWNDTVIANLAPVPFTQLANITGRPALSLPLHRTPEGLPLGVQFVGGLGSEGTLLALAAQLEAAHPWADHRPPL
jgi:amidase